MIPLLHLATSASFLFCVFASRKLYFSYKKIPSQNVGDFLRAYIALGVYFALVSLPSIIGNPEEVQVIYILANIPVILSAGFLLRVAVRILWLSESIKFISFFIYGLLLMITVFNIVFFAPAAILVSEGGQFFHWGTEGSPVWLVVFTGLSIIILASMCAFLFFWGGIKSAEKFVRTRAFLIGSGLSLLVVAASLNWIIPSFLQGMIRWLAGVLASGVALLGLILMLRGVYYRIDKS